MNKPPFHFVPLPKERSMRKPRKSGRTMIVDDGLPLAYARDLVALGFEAIEISDNVVPLTVRPAEADETWIGALRSRAWMKNRFSKRYRSSASTTRTTASTTSSAHTWTGNQAAGTTIRTPEASRSVKCPALNVSKTAAFACSAHSAIRAS